MACVDAKLVGECPVPQITLHEKGRLARSGNSLGELLGYEGLTLVWDGTREDDGLDRIIHVHETDIGEQRLYGVVYLNHVGFSLMGFA